MARLNKTLIEILEDARRDFQKIPGVASVGLGVKMVAGQIADAWVLRVYVFRKKPKSQVKPSVEIPRKYQGLRTDVLHAIGPNVLSSDSKGTRPLVGGLQMERANAASPEGRVPGLGTFNREKSIKGTLGYIVKDNTEHKPFILSCEHVLQSRVSTGLETSTVYQPADATCCKNDVAYVVAGGKFGKVNYPEEDPPNPNATDYFVDCAIAKILDKVKVLHRIQNMGSIGGTRDLVTEILLSNNPSPPNGKGIEVRKMGIKTGLTHGIIHDCAYNDPADIDDSVPVDSPLRFNAPNQILVLPEDSNTQKPFSARITLYAPGPSALTIANQHRTQLANLYQDYPAISFSVDNEPDGLALNYSTRLFGDKGDSGAVIVEDKDNGKVLGIIHRKGTLSLTERVHEDPNGGMIACHIAPVMQELRIDVPASSTPAAAELIELDQDAERPFPEVAQWAQEKFDKYQQEIAALSSGRELIDDIKTHAEEIAHLVHHKRKVKVAWHRNHGPEWVAYFAKVLRENSQWKRELKGTPLDVVLNKMYDALYETGDSTLQQGLKKYKDIAMKLVGQSRDLDEAMDLLKQELGDVQDH